ncbi:MAG: hypothetical protein NXH75_11970 [Halobacteriovoraceae bacterium]|nr:hypothetical protein [Halobacteriovoraceae bacterium]
MKKNTKETKEDQWEKAILRDIAPEKREDFKRLYRFNIYKESGLFYFLWHLALILISIPLIFLERALFPFLLRLDHFLFEEVLLSFIVFGFFHMVMFSFFTKNVRERINQAGVWCVHLGVLGLILIYGIIGISFYVKFQ